MIKILSIEKSITSSGTLRVAFLPDAQEAIETCGGFDNVFVYTKADTPFSLDLPQSFSRAAGDTIVLGDIATACLRQLGDDGWVWEKHELPKGTKLLPGMAVK